MAKVTAVDSGNLYEDMGVMDFGRMYGFRDEVGDEIWLNDRLVRFIVQQHGEFFTKGQRSEQHGRGAAGGDSDTGHGQARQGQEAEAGDADGSGVA